MALIRNNRRKVSRRFISLLRRKKEEGRSKKEEGRRKKEEGRRKKEEGKRNYTKSGLNTPVFFSPRRRTLFV
ncbi:hypothetical protein [Phormidium nigroviride]